MTEASSARDAKEVSPAQDVTDVSPAPAVADHVALMVWVAEQCAAQMPLLCTCEPLHVAAQHALAHHKQHQELRIRHLLQRVVDAFALVFCDLYHAARSTQRGRVSRFTYVSAEEVTAWHKHISADTCFYEWLAAACCTAALTSACSNGHDHACASGLLKQHRRWRNDMYVEFARNSGMHSGVDQLTLDALSALWSRVECCAWVCVNAIAKVSQAHIPITDRRNREASDQGKM